MNLDTTFNDFSVNNPSSGDLSTGSCVVEPTAANNRVCRTLFVHEPLPDVTAEVINRPDLLLRDMADSGVPVTGQQMDGAGVIVQVSNIGEAPTSGPVWVQLNRIDSVGVSDIVGRTQTFSSVLPGTPQFRSFNWTPITSTNNLEVILDNPLLQPCNAQPFGCEREYNDQAAGIDNNESERELPDIDVAGISATKK